MSKLCFKFFIRKSGCPKCEAAKEIIVDLSMGGFDVKPYYLDDDLVTPDGLAEASYYSVQSVPTLVLVREYDDGVATEQTIGRWTGRISMDRINEVLSENLRGKQNENY